MPSHLSVIVHSHNYQTLKKKKEKKVDNNLDHFFSEKQQSEMGCMFQNLKKKDHKEPNKYVTYETNDDENEPIGYYYPQSLKKSGERQDMEYFRGDETDDDEEESIVDEAVDEYIHMWVVIREGHRDVKSTLCVDACTGRVFEARKCPFLKVEAIINHMQFWINMLDPEKKARYYQVSLFVSFLPCILSIVSLPTLASYI